MAEHHVEKSFNAAVDLVRSMPKQGTFRPSYESMLKFYGLFKQAKEGSCTEPRPGFWDVIKKAKWEAWSSLGNMNKAEAMEKYVNELKKMMQDIPDTEQVAEFTEVLRDFYEVAYEVNDEEPPAILRVFKKNKVVYSKVSAQEFQSNGQDNTLQNGCHEKTDSLNGEGLENGVNKPQFIVDVKQLKKDQDHNKDSRIPNGDGEGHSPKSNGHAEAYQKNTEQLTTSDDSDDEEFCDSLDPEHLQGLQNGSMVNLNGDRSSSDSSPGQSSNSTYAELSEADDQFSSTPLHRKVLHVSFADEEQSGPERQTCEPSFDKIEESSLQCHQPASVDRVPAMEGEYERVWTAANGDLLAPLEAVDAGKVEGILKPYQAGGGGGGGETGQRQSMSSRESRGEGQQLQNQRGTRAAPASGAREGVPSRGFKRHSDSDSDDDEPTSRSDYDSADEERTSRILDALEQLQQDMNSILRRLDNMETGRPSTGDSSGAVSQPWWTQYIPSKTVTFLILWPFLVNIILRYFRRRKVVNP